ncbi:MAG: ATP-dependent zinc metalloprotease FtsH [Clostridia bacterium]|nr:ATP-dependent zinc metalloprotease FtsH [Clostridia bacterium]
MDKNDSNRKKTGKLPVFVYYLIILAVVFVLWFLLVPRASRPTYKEITYSEFIKMVEDDLVKKVELSDTTITIQPKEEDAQKPVYYRTGMLTVSDVNVVDLLLEHGVEFGSPIVKSSFWTNILSLVLMVGASWLMLFLVFRIMSKRMGGNVMSLGKGTGKIYGQKSTGKTFEDVAGQDEAKLQLTEIVDFLENPGKYTEIGAKLPKGALLVGPPGTGKTLLAKAVAGEANVPFFSISGSEFVEMFVGLGASRVRDLFKQAVEKAPCIVFIDEIDAIGKTRDTLIGGNDEREQTLNQLLAEMDGFDSSKGVVILAATNRPEVLDKALLRPGRFDRRVIVDLPDLEGRKAILKVHAKGVKMDPDIDFDAIALSTPGASGADLENIINESALRAVRAKKTSVSQKELQDAVEVVIAGEEKKSTVLSEHEKRVVAYHEIGHALVSALLTHTEPVSKITIIPRTSGALGYTMQTPKEEKHLMTRREALDEITVFAGGRASEELCFGEVTTGAVNDIEKATQLARSMVTRYGMSDKIGFVSLETRQSMYIGDSSTLDCSDETEREIDAEIRSIINDCCVKAGKILSDNREVLDTLSQILIERETISGKDFKDLLSERGIDLGPSRSDGAASCSENDGGKAASDVSTEETVCGDSKDGTVSEGGLLDHED